MIYPGIPLKDSPVLELDYTNLSVIVIDQESDFRNGVIDPNPCGHILIRLNEKTEPRYFHVSGLDFRSFQALAKSWQKRPLVLNESAFRSHLLKHPNIKVIYQKDYPISDPKKQRLLEIMLKTLMSQKWSYDLLYNNCQFFVESLLSQAGILIESKVESLAGFKKNIRCPRHDFTEERIQF